MKAGREADALVAEKVMGWTLVDVDRWEGEDPADCRWDVDDGWAWEGRVGDDYAHTWSPSTDISAAWEVVEEMRAQGMFVAVMGRPDAWEIEVVFEGGDSFHLDDLDTAPLAICLAALQAVGAAIPEATT